MPAKKKQSHLRLLILTGVFFSLTTLLLLQYADKKNKSVQQDDLDIVSETQETESLPVNIFTQAEALKRRIPEDFESSAANHPSNIVSTISQFSDDQLLSTRCHQDFIREEESGIYFYRLNDEHHLLPDQKINDDRLIGLIESAGLDSPVLAGRFCDMDNGKLLFEYTIGDENTHYLNAQNTVTYLSLIDEDDDITQKQVEVTRQEFWSYPGCDPILAATTDEVAYLHCGIANGPSSTSLYFSVDFNTNSAQLLNTCTYTYDGTLSQSCEII